MKKILLTLLTVLSLSNFNTNAFNASKIKKKVKESYNNSLNVIKKHKKATIGTSVAIIIAPSLSYYLLKNKPNKIEEEEEFSKEDIKELKNIGLSDSKILSVYKSFKKNQSFAIEIKYDKIQKILKEIRLEDN